MSRFFKDAIALTMLGVLMYLSDMLMEFLPNIHLVGVLLVAYTVVFRSKALIALYVYVFLNGLFGGFSLWWLPYLYVWLPLWGAVMLLPRNLPTKWQMLLYPALCALHGLSFGTLYAPAQMVLFFRMDVERTLLWIAAGFPFDVIHAAGNLCLGVLIVPLTRALRRAYRAAFQN